MADIYPDQLPNLVAFSLRDKETGESETNLNNVIDQDSIEVISHLEESPEDRAFVHLRSAMADYYEYNPATSTTVNESQCGNDHDPMYLRPVVSDVQDKNVEDSLYLRAMSQRPVTRKSPEVRAFVHLRSAMADYYEYNNTTSARACDIDQYKYNPATSNTVNECQCGNDHDPMYLRPVVSDVQDKDVEDSLYYLRAMNFETAVEITSARASDMEHHECNAETSAIEGDIESNDEDASDIMSQCTCSQFRKQLLKCHCYDPRYLGPGVDASVQNEEKDCVHINIAKFETDVDKTADNVDDANAKVAIPENPDANAKVAIEVLQNAGNERIRAQQNNRHFVIRQFINNFQDHDRIRRTVQVRLPGSEERRELHMLVLMSLLKSLLLLLFLNLTMMLLKKYDPTLDNFFSCFAYYGCYYLGGTLVVCIFGDAFIKHMEFFIKKYPSKWKRLFVQVYVLVLIMLWAFLVFNFLSDL